MEIKEIKDKKMKNSTIYYNILELSVFQKINKLSGS